MKPVHCLLKSLYLSCISIMDSISTNASFIRRNKTKDKRKTNERRRGDPSPRQGLAGWLAQPGSAGNLSGRGRGKTRRHATALPVRARARDTSRLVLRPAAIPETVRPARGFLWAFPPLHSWTPRTRVRSWRAPRYGLRGAAAGRAPWWGEGRRAPWRAWRGLEAGACRGLLLLSAWGPGLRAPHPHLFLTVSPGGWRDGTGQFRSRLGCRVALQSPQGSVAHSRRHIPHVDHARR